MIFDCRGALQIRMGNTALVVVDGVTELVWRGADPPRPRIALTVGDWAPRLEAGTWSVRVGWFTAGTLEVTGTAAEFYVGDVPGCDEAPPDFGEATDAEVNAGLAWWDSRFDPIHASFTVPPWSARARPWLPRT
jgi:hypothetical protein